MQSSPGLSLRCVSQTGRRGERLRALAPEQPRGAWVTGPAQIKGTSQRLEQYGEAERSITLASDLKTYATHNMQPATFRDKSKMASIAKRVFGKCRRCVYGLNLGLKLRPAVNTEGDRGATQ